LKSSPAFWFTQKPLEHVWHKPHSLSTEHIVVVVEVLVEVDVVELVVVVVVVEVEDVVVVVEVVVDVEAIYFSKEPRSRPLLTS
jgi:hypothetical protein